jgi:hypothetical protein
MRIGDLPSHDIAKMRRFLLRGERGVEGGLEGVWDTRDANA